MRPSTLLRQLIHAPDILRLPAAHDALTARIAAAVGAKAICAGGYGASASLLGQPDVSLLTQTEMADQVARLAEASGLPVLADADTGHGGPLNVARTVRLFERAGAAGLFIEDQLFPKRCGHMDGKRIVPRAEMLARLRAALDARTDPDFVIMARTDAITAPASGAPGETEGLAEALERGRLLQEAGADLIFVESPRNEEEMRAINQAITAPTFAIHLEGGKTPPLPASRFQELGFAVVAYAASGLYAAAHAIRETLREIVTDGDTAESRARMIAFAEFNALLGLGKLREEERRYLAPRPDGGA